MPTADPAVAVPEAVLFDLGDTLIAAGSLDSWAGMEAVLALATDRNDVTVEQALEAGNRLVPIEEIRRRTKESELEFPISWFLRLLFDRLGVLFACPPSDCERAYWTAAYEPMPPTPGIGAFLDVLGAGHIPTGVVSNASFRGPTLEFELRRAGLRDRLGFVMSSADYGLRKPHPAMLEVALARLATPANRTWFCGNKRDVDVAAARAAGTVAVWYAQDGADPGDPSPDLVIRHWDEVTAIVRDRGEPR